MKTNIEVYELPQRLRKWQRNEAEEAEAEEMLYEDKSEQESLGRDAEWKR